MIIYSISPKIINKNGQRVFINDTNFHYYMYDKEIDHDTFSKYIDELIQWFDISYINTKFPYISHIQLLFDNIDYKYTQDNCIDLCDITIRFNDIKIDTKKFINDIIINIIDKDKIIMIKYILKYILPYKLHTDYCDKSILNDLIEDNATIKYKILRFEDRLKGIYTILEYIVLNYNDISEYIRNIVEIIPIKLFNYINILIRVFEHLLSMMQHLRSCKNIFRHPR